MSNNRDDKFEGQDDSEYHFSDEEVSYEVESDSSKTVSAASQDQGGGGIASRLTGSRRMLISAGVFLAIVLVVYKMVSPGSSTPSTDITSAPTVATQTPPAKPSQIATAPAAPTAPAAAPEAPVAPAVATTTPPPAGPSLPPQQVVQGQEAPAIPATQNPPAVATLPAVIPVQSAPPAGQSPAAAMGAYIEEKSAVVSAASQQAMNQMQGQYTQQFSEFTNQNKSMENQIQSLSARVADMEAQINQLVQVLTRRTHNTPPPPPPGGVSSMNNYAPTVQPSRPPEVRVAYNVQAIIPGRAWLKSENGETLTVAEGDVIRDVGRVTKIDPYDGVVEINTGTKAVSLSYGNG